jgi:hypothetical protein
MSNKRKTVDASLDSSARSMTATRSTLCIDVACSNPRAIADALMALLPSDVNKHHKGAKTLLQAFALVSSDLKHRANLASRANEVTGTEKAFRFSGDQIILPEDTALHILGYLKGTELVHNASLVCKPWLAASRSPRLWQRMDA